MGGSIGNNEYGSSAITFNIETGRKGLKTLLKFLKDSLKSYEDMTTAILRVRQNELNNLKILRNLTTITINQIFVLGK